MDITTKNVSIRLAGKLIVDNASIHVDMGKVVGLFGPNGSGKSTLLKSIYRTLKPESGEIMLDGRSLKNMSRQESSRLLAVVTQFTTLNFDFSVNEMVLMGRSPHKSLLSKDTPEDFAIVRESLARVGMTEFAERKFSTLSGGEKQRVLLARALAQQTEMLVLDEPTNHLDIKYQLQTMEIIRGLNKGVLLALHDLNLAFTYCDFVYLMKSGRVIAGGTPDEVITEPVIREVYEVESRIYISPVTGKKCIAFLPENT